MLPSQEKKNEEAKDSKTDEHKTFFCPSIIHLFPEAGVIDVFDDVNFCHRASSLDPFTRSALVKTRFKLNFFCRAKLGASRTWIYMNFLLQLPLPTFW